MEIAVMSAGGKQYRVSPGDTIVMDRLDGEAGESRVFDRVLLLETDEGARAGAPYLENVAVRATVLEHLRGDKIRVFKMRRRKKSRRTIGHRQDLSRVRIDGIDAAAPRKSKQKAE